MAGTFTPVHLCEKPVPIQRNLPRVAPTLQELSADKVTDIFTHASEPLLEGALAIGICPGSCWTIRRCATALRPPCSFPPLERVMGTVP